MFLQLVVSLGFIYLCPLLEGKCGLSLVAWHWIYLAAALVLLAVAYILFKKKYYHLHEVLLCGKAEEIIYDGEGRETERLLMDPEAGSYGCVVPAGSWHTIVALEPTVIMEVKDGRYGEDGSESFCNNQ